MSTFVQDFRYGARALWKNPGFAAVAVLTLALGVGANAAIFSVLRGVVLRDLPYHDADRLAVMWTKNIRQNLPDGSSYLNFRDWKAQSKTFQDMAAFYRPEFTRGTFTDGSSSERLHLALVGPGFFQLLGTSPIVGRVEIALAVILLSGAGLLLRSFLRVQATNRGFDSSNVLLLQIDLPGTYTDRPKTVAFYEEAIRRIRSLPGVVAVGAVSDFFIHRQPDYRIALEGQPPTRPDDPAPPLTEDIVIPGYFEAMRVPLLRGRLLQDGDLAPDAPRVVVINEEMARRFWPGQDPIGKRFKYGLDSGTTQPWKTVVGLVADMRRQRLDEPAIPYMFQPGIGSAMDIAVRTSGDPDTLRAAIRAELRAIDPMAPPYGMVTVEQRFSRTVALRRLQTLLLAALAAVALVLSVIGAYGVIHQSVAARTQEIGIRMALGANAPAVLRTVLASGMAPALTGLALGLLGSLALSRTIASFLYETNPLDPIIYGAVTVLLLVVTIIACLAPARRAARFDPMAALRT